MPTTNPKELQQDYDLDPDTAEEVSEIMEDYDVDAEDAIEIEEGM